MSKAFTRRGRLHGGFGQDVGAWLARRLEKPASSMQGAEEGFSRLPVSSEIARPLHRAIDGGRTGKTRCARPDLVGQSDLSGLMGLLGDLPDAEGLLVGDLYGWLSTAACQRVTPLREGEIAGFVGEALSQLHALNEGHVGAGAHRRNQPWGEGRGVDRCFRRVDGRRD